MQVGDGDPARQLHNGQRKGGKRQKQSILSNRVAQAADPNISHTIRLWKEQMNHRCVVGVRGGHSSGGLGGELADLVGGDALVDASADLLCDEDGVAVLRAEAVAELLEPRGDLVEVDRLLPAVALHHVHRAAAADPAGVSGFPSNRQGVPG